jgi:hypothetical protein
MIAATEIADDLPVYPCNPAAFSGIGALDVIAVPQPQPNRGSSQWVQLSCEADTCMRACVSPLTFAMGMITAGRLAMSAAAAMFSLGWPCSRRLSRGIGWCPLRSRVSPPPNTFLSTRPLTPAHAAISMAA